MEIWKDIKNYENWYQVSNYGRIRSIDRLVNTSIKHNEYCLKKGKLLKLNEKRNGYLTVDLTKNSNKKTISVHRLVAETFIPNIENKEQVNHINANKKDNRVENLEWVTAEENRNHAKENNLYISKRKQKVRCKQTNMIFESSYEAGEWVNKTKFKYSKNTKNIANKIRCCVNGYQKKAYDYTWEKVI